MSVLDDLKHRARAGDREALQQLRESGFFAQQRAARGYPVSHGQRRLWVLSQMAGDTPTYHIPLALRLDGELDAGALARALETLAARHESLRTTFAMVGTELRQFVQAATEFRLPETVLGADSEEEARALAASHAASAFDLQAGPLWKAALIRLGSPRCHVFLFNIHHIVCDAASLAVLVQELSLLYQAYTEGRENPLPPLGIQYKDYAAWQHRQLATPEAQGHRDYWRAKLSGAPVLDLPLDYPRPEVMGFAGKTVYTTVDKSPLEDLRRGMVATSLFMILVAAVKILLYRYTGQSDITVGCPIAGREHSGLEGQIGFFVNTLALRDQLNGADRFEGVLKKVRRTALEAYEHQLIPFDQLVTELGLERDLSRSPLFDVMVTLETDEQPQLRLGGVEVSEFDCNFAIAKFDLTFHFTETPDQLRLGLGYNRALFCDDKARAMTEHLARLIEDSAARPDTPIGLLAMLGETERRRILVGFNATAVPYPRDQGVVARFQEQAARRPESIAVEHGAAWISYGDLNVRANQLAHHLRSLGVGPEVIVAVCARRSLEMVVGWLGVLKAGGAYLPLDPSYPPERLAFMLADARVPILLSQAELEAQLLDTEARVIHLDAQGGDRLRGSDPEPLAGPDNLAYLIYTSGSTGRPKGVAIAHEGLANLVRWHQDRFAITAEDRATQLAGTTFDASVWELWPYLAAGACINLVDSEISGVPERLRDWLLAQRITISFLPTPLAELMLSLEWPEEAALRFLLTGGDRLSRRPPPGLSFELVNNYGPTENTVVTTSGSVTPAKLDAPPPSLGRPIANTRVYILDRHLQPVPIGVPGELCIAGPGLARGYHGHPGLTALGFIPSPFGETPGERLYKTGDRARYRSDGAIDYLGRLDQQIKIRGFRIEPGEIEIALNGHPQVREAVVVARTAADGGKQLIAYLVPRGVAPNDAELRRYLGRSLPSYMLPAAFVRLEAVPLTSHGKVDREALPDPAIRPGSDSVAPRTALEQGLADIYREVLGVGQVGVEDNFFELGGHSLSATQVLSRVRETFRVEVPLPEFFQGASVAELASTVTGREARAGQAEKIAQVLDRLKHLSEDEKRRLRERHRET